MNSVAQTDPTVVQAIATVQCTDTIPRQKTTAAAQVGMHTSSVVDHTIHEGTVLNKIGFSAPQDPPLQASFRWYGPRAAASVATNRAASARAWPPEAHHRQPLPIR